METQTELGKYDFRFDWHNYNLSQTKEKLLFMKMLKELCATIENPLYRTGSRPIKLSDAVFGLTLRTYCGLSARRFQSDLKIAKEAGYLIKTYCYNTMLDHLQHPVLRDTLKQLIEISAMPLKQVEKDFAIDATGFSTSKFQRWCDIRTQKAYTKRVWRKCHAVCGVKTNIVTSIEITPGMDSDMNQFGSLIKQTANNFDIRQISADKGYSSRKNMDIASKLGIIPYMAFKSNATRHSRGSDIWKQMFTLFNKYQAEFDKEYHKRSNIESVWSMIKARFGFNLKSMKEYTQDNEILLKVLCHNLCVLVQEIFLRGIEIDFGVQAERHIAQI